MTMYDAGVSLAGFACFVTPDLARDLANDVMSLVSYRIHSFGKIQIRISDPRSLRSWCTIGTWF